MRDVHDSTAYKFPAKIKSEIEGIIREIHPDAFGFNFKTSYYGQKGETYVSYRTKKSHDDDYDGYGHAMLAPGMEIQYKSDGSTGPDYEWVIYLFDPWKL
ncbi:MAG: hypothetical protein MPK62_00845 [Alphaproteobacteria bacterium]|nr:hypothetical protein [Alphaproteobacteria bacterium]MDA8029681.1 hypothetical protein [Alphaproteobacteria bacterium]